MANKTNVINALKQNFAKSWFFPRYIGTVYIEPALKESCSYVQGTMLDVGCGKRRYEPVFMNYVERYIGLDWPQSASQANPDVIVDALKMPLKPGSIDSVVATELMEHLPSPREFLSEVNRVLREKGVLILSIPFMEPLHEEPRDYYRFTPYSLKLLLEEYSFSIQRMWQRGGWWSVVLGSFVNQAVYDWANGPDKTGHRRYGCLTIVVLPFCAFAQWLGYRLDRLFSSRKYTLGYLVVATRTSRELAKSFDPNNIEKI